MDGYSTTLYMLLVARTVPSLVLTIVTGIGRSGGVVRRRIDRSISVGMHYFLIVGPMERLEYVTGKCVEQTYLARHHAHG